MQIFRQLVNKTKREKEDSFKGGGGEFSQDDSRGEQKFQKAVALQRELKVRRNRLGREKAEMQYRERETGIGAEIQWARAVRVVDQKQQNRLSEWKQEANYMQANAVSVSN